MCHLQKCWISVHVISLIGSIACKIEVLYFMFNSLDREGFPQLFIFLFVKYI